MPLNKSSFFLDERLIHLAYEPSVAGAVFPSPSPPTVSVVVREEN